MFNFIWRRFTQWQSRKAPIKRRSERARLGVEMLESRLTPSATASILNTTLTVTATGSGDSLIVTNAGFEKFTIADGSLINNVSSITTTSPVTAMVFNLGSGSNSLTFSGTNASPIDLTGPTTFKSPATYTQSTATPDLSITGTGGNKTISATDLFLLQNTAGLTMSFGTGAGTETTTFTDSNITGSAIVTHSGSGDTSFTIATSINNTSALNTWGSLSITNGAGSDINSITDTDFTGNVAINNGAGDGTTGTDGGSQTLFADGLNKNLLTIGGNLTVSTTSDQSDTEINDYNVHGALSITGGTGINNQSAANIVGVENNPTNLGNGVPTFGSVSITSGGFGSPGFEAELGTNSLTLPPTQDTPFIVATTLSVSATGTGEVAMILNDLTVGGAATLATAATTTGADIAVLGDNATSTYGSLTINASANPNSLNDVYLQTVPGTLKILGALGVNFGSEDDTLLVGSAYVPGSAGPPAVAATPPGTVTSSGAFGVTGTGGSKIVTVVGATFNGMNWALHGTGTGNAGGNNNSEAVTFTDTNVTGTATINNTLVGNTSFTIQTSKNNTALLNTWGTLSITNGTGSDINDITDTDFTGSVTINNGAGATGSTAQYGGSHTTFSDDTNGYNTDQLTIAGNLTITTTTGQSDTEVQDYNIHGNVTLGAGAGIASQGSVIGLEDNQTVYTPTPPATSPSTTSGMPMIGGSVTITGAAVTHTTLTVAVGTGTTIPANGDFPLIIGNGINATITGAGTANVTLNDLTVTGTSNLSVAATGADTVTVQETNGVPTTYGPLTISALAGVNGTNTVNLQNVAGALNVVGALTVSMGAGTDVLNVGSTTSNVDVTGTFALTGALAGSNAITVTAPDDTFGALNWTLSGQGTETALVTDSNVIGVATINTSKLTGAVGTTGLGANATTTFTINTSAANTAALNTWGGLSITNGTGSDINTIQDTDFTGNVSIANGAGATGDTSQYGGSENIFSDGRNKDLLTIHGTLSITTTTGQSDTEIYDYNVHGNVTLGAGAGLSTQSNPNVIGLEDNQKVAGSGTPVFGGSVTITGGTVTGSAANPLSPGLFIDLGTNQAGNKNYPAIIQGALSITTTGTGAANLDLNDLSVANAATTITLASTNKNDSVQVQGSTTVTSVYAAFTITSAATVANTFSFQDTAGNLEFTGTVKVTLGSGADTLNLAADAINTSGVTNAVIDLFGMSTFNGGAGTNTGHEGTPGTNVFYLDTPTFTDI